MTAMTHVGPEEVMAWVDGELAADEAGGVELHVAECGECAAVAAEFRGMSEQLGAWRVEEVPGRVEVGVMGRVGGGRTPLVTMRPSRMGHPRLWRWGMGIGGVLAAAVLLLVVVSPRPHVDVKSAMVEPRQFDRLDMAAKSQPEANAPAPAGIAGRADEADSRVAATMKDARVDAAGGGGAPLAAKLAAPSPPPVAAPMIARSVTLTVQVKDVGESRVAVDALVARHHGYAAQMNANSAEGSARGFMASLRIPAPELGVALQELRGLGKVEHETQSGEEVTEQHQDLVARLKNSREEETRLEAILAQRTGRLTDVLEVEQEIARVRGEIESMEAEQAGLEHRVEFASVDLMLEEQYKAEFLTPDSVGTRLRNALVAGVGNARDMVLGMVLFAEEVGPGLVVWGMLLAVPGVWVWRRYRRALR